MPVCSSVLMYFHLIDGNIYHKIFQLAQMVNNQPTMLDRSLGQEDPLDKGIATHSRILAWRIPWTEEPHRLESMGSQRVKLT